MEITLIAVQSVNGKITHGERGGVEFASAADHAWFRDTLAGMDLVLLGGETYRAERERIRKGAQAGTPRWVFTRSPEAFAQDTISGKLEFRLLERDALLKDIEQGGYQKVALVGGPALSAWFFEQGLVDSLYLTMEPFLYASGKPLVEIMGDIALSLESVETLSQETILLKYRLPVLFN